MVGRKEEQKGKKERKEIIELLVKGGRKERIARKRNVRNNRIVGGQVQRIKRNNMKKRVEILIIGGRTNTKK